MDPVCGEVKIETMEVGAGVRSCRFRAFRNLQEGFPSAGFARALLFISTVPSM